MIAHGPPACRGPAVMHLFHYWPELNPAITDRTGTHFKYTGEHLFISYVSLSVYSRGLFPRFPFMPFLGIC